MKIQLSRFSYELILQFDFLNFSNYNGINFIAGIMKVIFFGDIHSKVKEFNEIANKIEGDAIFQLGDLGLFLDIERAKKVDRKFYRKNPELVIESYRVIKENIIKPFKMPLYFIRGNHDDFEEMQRLESFNIYHLRTGDYIEIEGKIFLSFGGIYSPKRFPLPRASLSPVEIKYYVKEEVDSLLEKWKGKKVDFLLTHEAPTGIIPGKWYEGGSVIRKLVKELNPEYLIHGHHHTAYVSKIKQTTIIGLGNFSTDILSSIACFSNGEFIFGKDFSNLEELLKEINKRGK